jgi:hypothetical protein
VQLNLRTATYEQFITFVFDHYPEDEVDDKWYSKLAPEIEMEPRRAIAYLTQALLSGAKLLDNYTPRQIAEGLEYLLCGDSSGFLQQLWNSEVPWPERAKCIRAISNIYTDVLETDADGVGGCAYMLWDWIAYGYYCDNRHPATNVEDARVQEVMFETLTSMLSSRHQETQLGAIHGLGHLSHRDSSRALRDFLASQLPLSPEVRAYAANVIEGHFQ